MPKTPKLQAMSDDCYWFTDKRVLRTGSKAWLAIPGLPLPVLRMHSCLDVDCTPGRDLLTMDDCYATFHLHLNKIYWGPTIKESVFSCYRGLALQNFVNRMNVLTIAFQACVCNQFTVSKLIQQWSSMITRGADSNVVLLPRQTKFINYILINFGGIVDYDCYE